MRAINLIVGIFCVFMLLSCGDSRYTTHQRHNYQQEVKKQKKTNNKCIESASIESKRKVPPYKK